MATRSTGGATMELQQLGYNNLKKNIKKVRENSDMSAMKGLMKFLYQIKLLAQQKLKSDGHVVTSRLRNSIYVQTPVKGNSSYSDENGGTFDAEMKTLGLKHNEAAVGTNVEYANKIEYYHDSFLYWGMKNADVNKIGKEIAKELLNGVK